VFRAGAGGLAIMASTIGGGAILGGIWLGHRAHSAGLIRIVLGSSLAGALAAMAAVATDRLWAALPALLIFGFSMSAAGIATQTLIQLASARNMRGRVMGLYGLIFRGAPALGALAAGAASSHVGLRWTVFCGALLVVATWLWCYCVRERITSSLQSQELNSAS
jgi:predicted MFS family arabinose efflux permease